MPLRLFTILSAIVLGVGVNAYAQAAGRVSGSGLAVDRTGAAFVVLRRLRRHADTTAFPQQQPGHDERAHHEQYIGEGESR